MPSNIRIKKTDDETEILAFVEAIRDEVQTAWDGYCLEIHPAINALPSGDYFDVIYPVSTDTFTIYDNGASIVGKIDDAELRNSVVKTYGLAKSLILSFQLNNSMVAEYRQLSLLYRQPDRDAVLSARADSLRIYASKLKELDSAIADAVAGLLARTGEWVAKHAIP
jgi:hypothetical protein